MHIKYFVVFIVMASANGQLLNSDVQRVSETCRQRANLTTEELLQAVNNLDAVGNYLVCVLEEFGLLEKDGSINVNAIVNRISSVVPPIFARPLLKTCNIQAQAAGPSLTGRVVAFGKCLLAVVPNVLSGTGGLLQSVLRIL